MFGLFLKIRCTLCYKPLTDDQKPHNKYEGILNNNNNNKVTKSTLWITEIKKVKIKLVI